MANVFLPVESIPPEQIISSCWHDLSGQKAPHSSPVVSDGTVDGMQ